MKTLELKEYINRTLGNSIRCLLPSYWWKRLFGLVVDKVNDIEVVAETTQTLVESKATFNETIILSSDTTLIQMPQRGAIYSVDSSIYHSSYKNLELNLRVWDTTYKLGATDECLLTLWFRGKKSFSAYDLSGDITNWICTPQNIDLSNLDENSTYKVEILANKNEWGSIFEFYTITEYSDNQSWYDAELSETSTNAVQSKAVKEYVDNALSNVSIEVDSAMSETSENAVQNKVVKDYVDTAISEAITNTLNTAV